MVGHFARGLLLFLTLFPREFLEFGRDGELMVSHTAAPGWVEGVVAEIGKSRRGRTPRRDLWCSRAKCSRLRVS
jgi:hypothetical protein